MLRETSLERARGCSGRAAGRAAPGDPAGSGRLRRAGFRRDSRKEATAAGLPRAAGRCWRQKAPGGEGLRGSGKPRPPAVPSGGPSSPARGAGSQRGTQPPSGRAAAPTCAWSPQSPWAAAWGHAEDAAFEGQGVRRHFKLLGAGPQERGSGRCPATPRSCPRRTRRGQGFRRPARGMSRSLLPTSRTQPRGQALCSQTGQKPPNQKQTTNKN